MNSSSAKRSVLAATLVVAYVVVLHLPIRAEDGYRLWMRYDALTKSEIERYRSTVTHVVIEGSSPALDAARSELSVGLSGMLADEIKVSSTLTNDSSLLVGTPGYSPLIPSANLTKELAACGDEGFVIRATRV